MTSFSYRRTGGQCQANVQLIFQLIRSFGQGWPVHHSLVSSPSIPCASIQVRPMIVGRQMSFIPCSFVEPIGSASPKFTSDTKSSTYERVSGSAISVTCPAQGFPLPAFRLGFGGLHVDKVLSFLRASRKRQSKVHKRHKIVFL